VTDFGASGAARSHAPILWVKGSDGITEYLDTRGAEYFGLDSDEVFGQSWFDLIHPDDVAEARRSWRDVCGRGKLYETKMRMRGASGTYRAMIERGSPIVGRDHTIARWIGTLTDVELEREVGEGRRRSQNEADENRAFLDAFQTNAPLGILFVDRHFRYVRVNDKVAAIHGSRSVEEHLGHTVAEVVPALWTQLEAPYRSVLESGQPIYNLELTGPTAEDPGHAHAWLESIYPVRVADEIVGLGIVLVDITDRKRSEMALAALTEAAVDAIAAAAEARDPYTAGHQRRVAELSVAIATELGMAPNDVEGVRIAAKIHDVGKLRMPSEILNKPGELRDSELALLREHVQAGYEIVQGIDFPWPIAAMILQHHERMDGSGYPYGLAGEQILLGARIIAVADIVHAMASHRPYRPSRGLAAALRLVAHDRGTRLDADVVDACIRLFHQHQFTFARDPVIAQDHDL
jgi:PAS domain S-box-containing protein/putative nucleotidyltransferase with HDIG domain